MFPINQPFSAILSVKLPGFSLLFSKTLLEPGMVFRGLRLGDGPHDLENRRVDAGSNFGGVGRFRLPETDPVRG